MATFQERFRQMLQLTDPRTLLRSYSHDQIRESESIVNESATSPLHSKEGGQQQQYYWASKVVASSVHPDTKEIIPMPFRMSGFLFFNAPICVGALLATSTPGILFFHWANQTHNALVNYYNRNASQPMPTEVLIRGYAGAVTGAVYVAMGLNALIRRRIPDPVRAGKVQRFAALPAIMTAAAINVLLMRGGELETGIDVYSSSTGNVVGTSQAAAKKALTEMTLSRMALPLPVFFLPPLGATIVEKVVPSIGASNKRASLALNAFLLFVGFGIGLPATIAIFPQKGSIEIAELEPEIQNKLKDSDDTIFTYNKGL